MDSPGGFGRSAVFATTGRGRHGEAVSFEAVVAVGWVSYCSSSFAFELTPSSEPDLSLLANGGCGAFGPCGAPGGPGAGLDGPLSEFSDPFAPTFGGGDCAFRGSVSFGCEDPAVPSEVCMFRFAGGKPCDGGTLFFDLPKKNDIVR